VVVVDVVVVVVVVIRDGLGGPKIFLLILIKCLMIWLNSFFYGRFFIRKNGTDSVNQANSGDIKILVQFPVKITQCVYFITSVIFIC